MTEYFRLSSNITRGLKNVSYLTLGSIIAQIIGFIGFIYISRILGPEEYGIYVTVGAFVGMFSLITLGGLQKVLIREGSKNTDIINVLIRRTIGLKIMLSLIAIIICIISTFITPYDQLVKIYIVLFSFTLLSTSLNSFFGSVYQANEQMQYNAIIQIFNKVLFVSLSIASLHLGYGLLSLFIISLLSSFITLLLNIKLLSNFIKVKFSMRVYWDSVIIKAAVIFSILAFAGFLTTRIDIIMISLLRPSEDVGIYGVPFKLVMSGLVLRNIVATAFFPIFVRTFNKRSVTWKRLLNYSLGLGIIILPFAIIISIFSQNFILFFFGPEYADSGPILSVLVFFLVLQFLTIPFTNALQATHNESVLLKIIWLFPTLNIVLNYFLLINYGLIGIAYSTLIVSAIRCSIIIMLTYFTLKRQSLIK